MSRLALLLAPFLIVATAAIAAPPAASPLGFRLPTPDGWRTETIPFPLDFAPELTYTGVEELRFAPGMFRAGADDFFSYSFVWSVDEPLALDPDRLAAELTVYFRGLGAAVRKGKKLPPLSLALPAKLARVSDHLVGTAVAFDAFTTQQELLLNVRIHPVDAPVGRGGALYFMLSPQPLSHPVWKTLREIGQGYRVRGLEG